MSNHIVTAHELEMRNTPPLNFSLERGLTHGLVGANGVGKTTLLRMIAGQRNARGLQVFGHAPFDLRYVLDRTILMGIDNPLPDGWNVATLCKLGRARWETWNQDRAEELIERFELPKKNYSGLSRGQKSAMGIIMACASGCELMLLDEPYLGLDVAKREVFFEVLAQEHGRTIIISTHHLNELAGHLDTVLLLADAPLAGQVGDILEAVVSLSGPAGLVDQAIAQLRLPILGRESSPVGDKVLIDARGHRVDEVFEAAAHLRLRAQEVSLEQAVTALATTGAGER
ncbi:ATP-binding cassette domain-containing protein [Corynebacterium lizhenjunii]|uniref:ATP-binding cassette domain-containing protein n=1 Tax=Corynebacterium lizhenjunii TaxID=2709394 RepID=UPI001F48E8A4|nr:ATP-binding cassette domain-containing protein [Corynebacterium lizhenjunii]